MQNRNITGNENHKTNASIYAGYSVNASIPLGNCIIKSGANVSIQAKQSILLQDGFEVETNAIFEANVGPILP